MADADLRAAIAAETVDLSKVYGEGQAQVRAVDGITIAVPTGS